MSKMTKQRKLLIGVLVLGVGAVVIDRAFLGGPDSASASDTPVSQASDMAAGPGDEPVAGADTPAAVQVPMGEGPVDLSEFARRLAGMPDVVDGALGRDDVFVPPAEWQPSLLEAATPEPEPVVNDGSLGIRFQSNHTHDGMMEVGDIDYALVDGQKICVNQIVDGFILRRFNARQSLWESTETGEFVLLPEPPTPRR